MSQRVSGELSNENSMAVTDQSEITNERQWNALTDELSEDEMDEILKALKMMHKLHIASGLSTESVDALMDKVKTIKKPQEHGVPHRKHCT